MYFGNLVWLRHSEGGSFDRGDDDVDARSVRQRGAPASRGAAWRDVACLAGEALLAGLFASFVLALAIFIVSSQAQAAGSPPATRGELLLAPETNAAPIAAPLLFTDVKIAV